MKSFLSMNSTNTQSIEVMANKYKVLLNGENFQLKDQVEGEAIGFFITVFIEADTEEQARLSAINELMTDSRLVDIKAIHPEKSTIVVDEITISDTSSQRQPGCSFYPM